MKLLSIVLGAVVLVACSGGNDNVGACKAFLTSAKCGAVDPSTQGVSCDAYKDTSCNIAPYFDCLSTKYVCVNGSYDLSKLSTVNECTSKAKCN